MAARPRERRRPTRGQVGTWSKTVPQRYRVNEIANQGHDCDKTVETRSFTEMNRDRILDISRHVSTNFNTFRPPYLDHISTTSRPYLDHISTISRQYLDHISTMSRPYLDHTSIISTYLDNISMPHGRVDRDRASSVSLSFPFTASTIDRLAGRSWSIVLASSTLSLAVHALRKLSRGPRVDRVTEPVATESFRASSLYSFVRLDLSPSFRCNRYNFCFKLRLRVEKY